MNSNIDRLREIDASLSAELPVEVTVAALFEMLLDGWAKVDVNGQIKKLSPSFAKAFGYSQGELVGENVNVLVRPEFREEHTKLVSGYFKSPTAITIGNRRVEGVSKNGSSVFVKVGIIPFEGDAVAVLQLTD